MDRETQLAIFAVFLLLLGAVPFLIATFSKETNPAHRWSVRALYALVGAFIAFGVGFGLDLPTWGVIACSVPGAATAAALMWRRPLVIDRD